MLMEMIEDRFGDRRKRRFEVWRGKPGIRVSDVEQRRGMWVLPTSKKNIGVSCRTRRKKRIHVSDQVKNRRVLPVKNVTCVVDWSVSP